MKRIISSAICIAVLLTSCEKKSIDFKEEKNLVLNQNDQALVKVMNEFTVKLFKDVKTKYDDNTNIMLSPYSAHVALSLVANGAAAETRDAIRSALGYNNSEFDRINTSQQKLIEGLPLVSLKNELSVANSIWANEVFEIVPSFLKIANDHYHARTTALPFVNPQAPDTINQWVKENTKGKIDHIIDEVADNDLLYVLNAVYFKGAWQDKFDPGQTAQGTFYKRDHSEVKADFMKNTANYNFFSSNGLEGVEIPYADEKFSMLLIKDQTGIIHYDLDMGKVLEMPNLGRRKIELVMPKFKFAFEHVLNDNLEKMGMGIAFTDAANFSNMIEDRPVKISEVKQKTFVEVNEEGTEAAAVTSVGVVLTSVPVIQTVRFDQPFLFVIRENLSGLVLFVGVMNDPSA
jgi:serpin B